MRLFLALDPPEDVATALGSLQEQLRASCTGWRWVRRGGIHLTVRFLGEVDPEVEARARPVWRRVAAGLPPLRLRFEGLGRFPPSGRPHVLYVQAHDTGEALMRLARETERAACEVGFEPERRPFRPHLTLARAARTGRPVSPPESLGLDPCRADLNQLTLFRSQLDPLGARYTVLATFPLCGPA